MNNGFKAIVELLYQKILKREADTSGLEHYVQRLESGEINARQLEDILLGSEEYKEKHSVPYKEKPETFDPEGVIRI